MYKYKLNNLYSFIYLLNIFNILFVDRKQNFLYLNANCKKSKKNKNKIIFN